MSEAAIAFSPEERARLRSDFPYFCHRLLKINPKIKELVAAKEAGDADVPSGTLIPFVWNEAQHEVWRIMCEQIAAGRPMRFVILKARQVGISTFFCAYIFWMMWRQMHTRAAIVAYEKKTTLAELNETLATFYDALPDGAKPRLRQHHKGARVAKEEMYFDDRKARAKFIVQKKGAGRGIASDVVLCTEVSFYDEADEFFGGFEPTMGSGTGSLLVKESSPEDGYFRTEYEDAKADGVYRRAIFIPWWFMRDLYWRAITRRGKRLFDAQTGSEVVLTPAIRKKQRHLSRLSSKLGRPPIADEQMWWWVHFCDTAYKGDEEWMQQEFPDDDVTAFQKASRSAFKIALPAVAATVEEIEDVFPDMACGTLQSTTYLDASLDYQRVFFEPEPRNGYIDQERRPGLLMLEPPREGFTYVIGADVADAEGEADEDGERAFSVGCVYCCNTRDQIAEWRGHLDPTDWGDELVKLGYFYNTALLVVERNNMGRLTEHRIRQLQYPSHRRFRWPDWNVGPHALTKKEMWETNATTKVLMIGALRQWIKDGLFRVRTPGLQHELAAYRVVRGKFETGDAHADRIIAAALAVQGVEQTEFAYKSIVLGANGMTSSRSAHGMAARILRESKVPPRPTDELPDEFDGLGVERVQDIFAAAGF